MKHMMGGKVTDTHTSVIEGACQVIHRAQDLPEVTKVCLGKITWLGQGKARIVFSPITGGLLVKIRGNIYMQEVWVYTSDPVNTREALFRAFWLDEKEDLCPLGQARLQAS